MTAPTAERVDSSASGHRWLYVSNVVRAVACLIRACTVLMSAPDAISRRRQVMTEVVEGKPFGQREDLVLEVAL
jgi:hypothetical protein